MKARPRRAERKVAVHFSKIFASLGYGPVERIPVLGRTGPDISINEMGLVIDVKSRLEVPKRYMTNCLTLCGELLCMPLSLLSFAASSGDDGSFLMTPLLLRVPACKTVDDYYDHMQKWTLVHRPADITCLVLHRPAMPFGQAMFIIHYSQREEFASRWNLQTKL